jgi:hypothetical protein
VTDSDNLPTYGIKILQTKSATYAHLVDGQSLEGWANTKQKKVLEVPTQLTSTECGLN